MTQQTLAIIKPDAVKKQAIGDIIQRYEKAGFAANCDQDVTDEQANG